MVAINLVQLAIDASKHAYVPYSHFPIGSALLTKEGHAFSGCNIENASFGLTNCGERTAIFKAVSEGYQELSEIVIYGQTKDPVSPCGACRQVMAEFFPPTAKVTLIAKDGRTQEMTVGDLLPYSFTDLK
ncbi:cytidine deaminase [Streptococcus parauberis]|uniref:cytidine deaminase n=1 Tax=Streptococcus parauberis TaxID=1348 RepID=UPI00288F4997|nr:cytidine deaminase [Streptococcus parauberis]MDT2749510.1 cytidine deaminase [Streptococcus parauberis]